jgi:CRISPR/Cas system-associated exonuclease Cas4 (RecB family)
LRDALNISAATKNAQIPMQKDPDKKPIVITKTGYMLFLKCPNEFWLSYQKPELFERIDDLKYRHLRQQGYDVQRLVREMSVFRTEPAERTVEFERDFKASGLFARSDIVATTTATGEIEIYEIKSSSKVKDDHIHDVAFQRVVAEANGFTVAKTFVITANPEFIRHGEIDPDELFVISDVTDLVSAIVDETREQIETAFAYLETEPVPSLIDYCNTDRLGCAFIRHHFPDLPERTIFDIPYLANDKRRQLLAEGIVDIVDIPDDFPLSANQRMQVTAARTGEIAIDRSEIEKRIESWEYPLHFLDYETFSYAIPQFDGIKPFQQMCFQYSLHTIAEPGAEVAHAFYLSRTDEDPPRAMAEHLRESLSGNIGTVFVWYEPFEKGRNSEMAEMFPELAGFFEEVNLKTHDLMKIFSDKLYVHPAFNGRSSIKKVLPVLIPELRYDELGINEGMTASISWFHAATWNTLDDAERQTIFADLEEYCEMDTRAMVEIFEVLRKLTKSTEDESRIIDILPGVQLELFSIR